MEITHPLAKEAKQLGMWLRYANCGLNSWMTPEAYQAIINEGKIIFNEQFLHIGDHMAALKEAKYKIKEMMQKTEAFEDRILQYYKEIAG